MKECAEMAFPGRMSNARVHRGRWRDQTAAAARCCLYERRADDVASWRQPLSASLFACPSLTDIYRRHSIRRWWMATFSPHSKRHERLMKWRISSTLQFVQTFIFKQNKNTDCADFRSNQPNRWAESLWRDLGFGNTRRSNKRGHPDDKSHPSGGLYGLFHQVLSRPNVISFGLNLYSWPVFYF